MNIRHIEKTVTGKRHAFEAKSNQDYIKIFENDKVFCITAADGASFSEYALIAAKINTDVAESIARNPLIWTIPEKKFRSLATNEFNVKLCESGYDYNELCSTIAFCIINKQTSEYITFSVGDCTVMAYNSDMRIRMLLDPQNGFKKSMTIFTNDEYGIKKIAKYHKGVLSDDTSGFILFTDGADSLAESPYTVARQLACAVNINEKCGETHLNELFESLAKINSDDITVGCVANVSEKSEAAARALYNGEIVEIEPEKSDSSDDCVDTIKNTEESISEINKSDTIVVAVMKKDDTAEPTKKVESLTLLSYLEIPRSLNDIVKSELFCTVDLIPALVTLIKLDLISINDNKFRRR
mgnify:FL=1